jgi:hypothetical protein
MALSRMSSIAVMDGRYVLRYTFDGKVYENPVRVENGFLLAGGVPV